MRELEKICSSLDDTKGFLKLFNLKVPTTDHLAYYIGVLSKMDAHKNIIQDIKDYVQLESEGHNLFEERIGISNKAIEKLHTSQSFAEMCADDTLIQNLPTTKEFNHKEGVNYLSLDLKSANFQAFKRYDYRDELGMDYKEFGERMGMYPMFIRSKNLRQFIFGRVNPAQQQKVQRNIVQEQVRLLYGCDIACVRTDEIILDVKHDEIHDILSVVDTDRYNVKYYYVVNIEDFQIKTFMDLDGSIIKKELFTVNGNMLFWKYAQYITGKFDERDMLFNMDGRMAKWII